MGIPVARRDLRGVTVRVTGHKASGYGRSIWNILMDHLHFTTVWVTSSGGAGAADRLGRWTGVVGTLQRGEADVCLALAAWTPERRRAVDFCAHGVTITSRMYIRKPEFHYSSTGLLKLFSTELWLSIAVVLLLSPVLLWAIFKIGRSRLLEVSVASLSDAYHCVFGCMMGQGASESPRSMGGRLAVLTLLLFSFLLGQFHASLLTSLLTARTNQLPFSSLEGLLARGRPAPVVTLRGSQVHVYAQEARSGVMKRLWDESIKDRPQMQVSLRNFSHASRHLCGRGAVLFAPAQLVETRAMRFSCGLAAVGPGCFRTVSAFMLRKQFPRRRLIDRCLQRMLEGGVLSRLLNSQVELSLEEEPSPKVEPIALDHVLPLVCLFVLCAALSLGICLCEIVIALWQAKTRRADPPSQYV